MNQGHPSLKSVQDFKNDINKKLTVLKKNKDLQKFSSELNAQKKSLEKKIKTVVQADIKQANKFLVARKKELNDFQKKVSSMIKSKIKKNGKKKR